MNSIKNLLKKALMEQDEKTHGGINRTDIAQNIDEAVEYLQSQYPQAKIFPSVDAESVIVRKVQGSSNLGLTQPVNSYKQKKFHIDTVRLMQLGVKDVPSL